MLVSNFERTFLSLTSTYFFNFFYSLIFLGVYFFSKFLDCFDFESFFSFFKIDFDYLLFFDLLVTSTIFLAFYFFSTVLVLFWLYFKA